MLNKVQIIGRLGADPMVRYLPDNTATANFQVATTERWKDKQGEQKERTEWVRCVAWGKLAEICGEYLAKGSLGYFEGKLETKKWQDNEGNDRYTTQVRLDVMRMLEKKGTSPTAGSAGDDTGSPRPATGDFDDDIPF